LAPKQAHPKQARAAIPAVIRPGGSSRIEAVRISMPGATHKIKASIPPRTAAISRLFIFHSKRQIKEQISANQIFYIQSRSFTRLALQYNMSVSARTVLDFREALMINAIRRVITALTLIVSGLDAHAAGETT
jgi:hypothetical protein